MSSKALLVTEPGCLRLGKIFPLQIRYLSIALNSLQGTMIFSTGVIGGIETEVTEAMFLKGQLKE